MAEIHVLMTDAGKDRVAIPIPSLVEVVARPGLTTMPGTPDWYLGFFLFRGVATPVVDLTRMLGHSPPPRLISNRVAIVRVSHAGEKLLVGIQVDRASAEKIRHRIAEQDQGSKQGLFPWGETLQEDSQVFYLLDLEKFLTEEKMKVLFPRHAD